MAQLTHTLRRPVRNTTSLIIKALVEVPDDFEIETYLILIRDNQCKMYDRVLCICMGFLGTLFVIMPKSLFMFISQKQGFYYKICWLMFCSILLYYTNIHTCETMSPMLCNEIIPFCYSITKIAFHHCQIILLVYPLSLVGWFSMLRIQYELVLVDWKLVT